MLKDLLTESGLENKGTDHCMNDGSPASNNV